MSIQERNKYPVSFFPQSDRLTINDEKTYKLLLQRGFRGKEMGPNHWEMWLPYPEGSPELLERQKRR